MKTSFPLVQLTHSLRGHMLHHSHVFSNNGTWIVFDGRNDETKIGETSVIGVVNTLTSEESIIYDTGSASKYGPGVGAASFHPSEDKVVFIHGLPNANASKPYTMSRRFAMEVSLSSPMEGTPLDARDICPPYTLGSLRGGTHSHAWNHDGSMLSFTYNDDGVQSDLRMVGVMVTADREIIVPNSADNHSGIKYAVIVSEVVADPTWGSDEISKAFDECWLGNTNCIVFQGHTRNDRGDLITEIFLVEIDTVGIFSDREAVGKLGQRPQVPKGIRQKRITHSLKGLSDFRHWLRSSPDGQFVYALAKDDIGNNQVVQCTISTGELTYLTALSFSISSPINIDYAGTQLTFVANNNIFLLDLCTLNICQVTDFTKDDPTIFGAPIFNRQNTHLAFNLLIKQEKEEHLQIFLLHLRQ